MCVYLCKLFMSTRETYHVQSITASATAAAVALNNNGNR